MAIKYNTKIIILSVGLTPKTQIMDTHNTNLYKANDCAKTLKLCLQNHMTWRHRQLAKGDSGPVGILSLLRDEIFDTMLQAWEVLAPFLSANTWRFFTLMPYELGVKEGWVPKDTHQKLWVPKDFCIKKEEDLEIPTLSVSSHQNNTNSSAQQQ